MTHICVSKLTITSSNNGLSPGRRQANIWTSAGILLMRTLETNFSKILGKIHSFSFKKMHLKMPSGNWQPSGIGLNVLRALRVDKAHGNNCFTIRKWHLSCWTRKVKIHVPDGIIYLPPVLKHALMSSPDLLPEPIESVTTTSMWNEY